MVAYQYYQVVKEVQSAGRKQQIMIPILGKYLNLWNLNIVLSLHSFSKYALSAKLMAGAALSVGLHVRTAYGLCT